MYILSAHPNYIQFCSEPRHFDYQREAYHVVSPAKTYLDELLQAGFTIKLLAKQCKISQSTLYRLVAGKTQKPTHKTFRSLLSAYCRLVVLQDPLCNQIPQ
ncbi:MAG: hypothetical protein K0S11_99 [Gammaproteobacteria bacterium]|jgi:AraC-like DNA-binding protein|nr:hypothetical protein [Gammaproteobacteria bacterium]